MTEPHVSPEDARIAAFAAAADDRPVVMLNLNRYRARADYPPGASDGDASGRDAYLRYGVVALEAIAAVGGRVLWQTTTVGDPVIGCDHDRYDDAIAVWYPSGAAFLGLAEHPGYLESHVHRDAGLEQALVIPLDASFVPT